MTNVEGLKPVIVQLIVFKYLILDKLNINFPPSKSLLKNWTEPSMQRGNFTMINDCEDADLLLILI